MLTTVLAVIFSLGFVALAIRNASIGDWFGFGFCLFMAIGFVAISIRDFREWKEEKREERS